MIGGIACLARVFFMESIQVLKLRQPVWLHTPTNLYHPNTGPRNHLRRYDWMSRVWFKPWSSGSPSWWVFGLNPQNLGCFAPMRFHNTFRFVPMENKKVGKGAVLDLSHVVNRHWKPKRGLNLRRYRLDHYRLWSSLARWDGWYISRDKAADGCARRPFCGNFWISNLQPTSENS